MIELDGIRLRHPKPCSGLFSCFSSNLIVDSDIFYKLYLSKTHLYKRYGDDETYEVGKITRFIKKDHEYLLWIDNTFVKHKPSLKVKIYDTEIHIQYYTKSEWYHTFLIKDQNNKFLKSMNDTYTIYHGDDVVTAC